MADVLNADYNQRPMHMAEFGNAFDEDFTWNKAASHSTSDKLYFGIIPAGVRVTNVDLTCDSNVASATLSLGFEPVDGSSPSAVLTQWFTTQTLATAGKFQSKSLPVTFEKAVKIVGSLAGASLTTSHNLCVSITGRCLGVK